MTVTIANVRKMHARRQTPTRLDFVWHPGGIGGGACTCRRHDDTGACGIVYASKGVTNACRLYMPCQKRNRMPRTCAGRTWHMRTVMRTLLSLTGVRKNSIRNGVLHGVACAYGVYAHQLNPDDATSVAHGFVHFYEACEAALAPLSHTGDSVSDIDGLLAVGLLLWAAMQGAGSSRVMRKAYLALTSPQAQQVADGAAWIAERYAGRVRNVEVVARRMQTLRSAMSAAIAVRLGMAGAAWAPWDARASQLADEKCLPDALYTMFRDVGVNVPLRPALGRSGVGLFGPRLTRFVADELGRQFAAPLELKHGVGHHLYRDLGRATIMVDGAEVCMPGDCPTAAAAALVGSFAGDGAGLMAASRVMHQGLFSSTLAGLFMGLGPFTERQHGGGALQYTVEHLTNGDLLVEGHLTSVPTRLTDAAGIAYMLAPTRSHFKTTIRVRISRQGVEAGKAHVSLVAPPLYSFCFMPEDAS